jgi:2-oxo-3-hexenedioate decarboxylase
MSWTVDRAAAVLLEAEDSRTDLSPITDEWPDLDLATAYAVQDETLRRRLARGEQLVGVKLGLTSRAKQQRMNISCPPGRPCPGTGSSTRGPNPRSCS